jgi:glycosyltransferase involved in cell wall biosynthesis
MKKIVILGTGPLPIENESYSYGSSNRTWHFAKGLLDRGHRVRVVAFRPMRTGEDGKLIRDEDHRKFSDGAFSLDSVDGVRHFYNDSFLKERIREADPDLLIGANVLPACRCAYLDTGLPFWADLNGFNMGEAQIRAHLTTDETALSQGWFFEIAALRRADVFSAASGPQRHALIGELAAIGRLRGSTCGYEFVHVIPNGREDLPPLDGKAPLREELGPDAALALWVGGYNYQFDVDSLFEGFETAMGKEPRLHFVSTGGKIDGHNEITFERFLDRVSTSPNKDRYHFFGWLPQEDFERLMRSSDMGVSMDLPCYETELGARNRITEMFRAGLPVITTSGPEIASDVGSFEAGWVLPTGCPEGVAGALLDAVSSPEDRKKRGESARRIFLEKYTIEASLKPLFEWVENPWTAPDRNQPPIRLPDFPPEPDEATAFPTRSLLRRILGRLR